MVDKVTKTVDNEIAKKDLNGDGHISTQPINCSVQLYTQVLEMVF